MSETSGVKSQRGLGVDLILAIGLAAILAVITWGIWIAPKIGVGFAGIFVISLAVIALSIVGGIWVALRRPDARSALKVVWPAFMAPVLGGGMLVVSMVRWSGTPEWAMQGDMVWNTVSALFIQEDGGVAIDTHANPAPLTNAILAVAYGLNPTFEAVLRGNAIVVVALLVLSSLLSGLHAARRTTHVHPFVSFLLVFGVGWLPFTGIALDGMFRLGLANVLSSYLVLWIAWIIYMADELGWQQRVGFLLITATVCLAGWAPSASIPGVLAVLLVLGTFREGKEAWRSAPRALIFPALSFLQLGLYAVLVTLPDLRIAGSHLGADGAYPPLDVAEALVLVMAIFLIAANAVQFFPRGSAGRRMGAGVLAVLAISVLVFLYLIRQRPPGESFWGYYPMKFTSLLIFLFVGVSVLLVAALIKRGQPVLRQTVIAAFALPLYLVAILGPAQWAINIHVFAPTVPAAISAPTAERVQMITDLIAVKDANLQGVEVFARWIDGQDALANTFLFQTEVERGDDPIRGFAYTFDPTNRNQLCEVVRTADQPVTVFTHLDQSVFQRQYLRDCEVADRVTVRNEVPAPSS